MSLLHDLSETDVEDLRRALRELANLGDRTTALRRPRCGECGVAIRAPRTQPSGHVRVCRGCSLLDAAGYSPLVHAHLELDQPGAAEGVTADSEIHALVLREPAAMRAWRRRTSE